MALCACHVKGFRQGGFSSTRTSCICTVRVFKCVNNLKTSQIYKALQFSYLAVVRKLQRTYTLEPAGSHGVWGLDDYQFLPYLWGSGQLIGIAQSPNVMTPSVDINCFISDHPRLKPSSILNEEVVESLAKDYLYFGCIHEINQVKLLTLAMLRFITYLNA
jgi:hypothetical protein